MSALLEALTLQAGYNTSLVLIGSALLGAGAGAIGVFVLLRKRALVSDAISHATLPGIALAFLFGAYVLGDGRSLALLLIGAALSAGIGVLAVDFMTRHTRLAEDTAIGTVLSTFFALGIVLLTFIQSLNVAGQAGLSSFILGSTAGLLLQDAYLIAAAALSVVVVLAIKVRDFTLLCFDPVFAEASGLKIASLDRLLLLLLLAIVVIGLKTAGLVLVIALTIIPPVAARFWTDRVGPMTVISAAIGALGSYTGAAISAIAADLPTGGLIVLTLFVAFTVSLLAAPKRGVLALWIKQWRFSRIVHRRQGLLAMARGEPIFDNLTRKMLLGEGLMRADGAATPKGAIEAQAMARDQALWNAYRRSYPTEALMLDEWSLAPIDTVLPKDLIDSLRPELVPHAVNEMKR
ncbi:MAG: metal ABC transporter permease [Pseudomonadota bacterium]